MHEKGYRSKPLTESQRKNKSDKAKIRGRIVHIFALITNSKNEALYLGQIGQHRFTTTIGLVNLTYSLFMYEPLISSKMYNVFVKC